MPSLWIYQIGFQAIAPVVDLTIAWSLFYSTFIAPNATATRTCSMLLGYWALVLDRGAGRARWLAFRLDREDKRLLGWLLLQRFVYRQLMYYVIVKSLVVAVRGSLVGWGKFERKGTVKVAPARPSANTAAAKTATPGRSDHRRQVARGEAASPSGCQAYCAGEYWISVNGPRQCAFGPSRSRGNGGGRRARRGSLLISRTAHCPSGRWTA